MSGQVRVRRPPSPPPNYSASHGAYHPSPSQPQHVPSQRFPHPKEEHLDADARRAAASLGLGPTRAKHHQELGGLGLGLTSGEWKLLFVIILVAAAVRLFRLSKPNSVVFDEVHFGKFASKYIKTRYYVDVHPPLAKLLITLAAFVFGYEGDFDFSDIGKLYENVPYVAMRMVPATLGVLTVPLAYLTLRSLHCRATTALLGSIFLTFENGLVTQSRHILLDAPLVFFTSLTTFFWCAFSNADRREPFTNTWWTWLVLTGLSLGAVVSCKWVGLFTIATVGASTVVQLWVLLGDLKVSPRTWMRHFMARAMCLIVLPLAFYMAMFQIHFLVLENSGDGDGFMSSEFQHTLGGRGMEDTFADVAIGSRISIRHVNTQGGYLHSHPHSYPGGSKQQQITLYPHRDHNNDFRILFANEESNNATDSSDIHFVMPGMRVKLQHIATSKHLHSHDMRPPVSDVDFQNEVSAYGMEGFAGDANDDWILEIEHGDKKDKESSKRLRTLRTVFRLRHALQGCYLFSHKVKLPEWGYGQQEVTCNKNAVKKNSLWYVETSTHEDFPDDAAKVNYKLPGFFAKFWELQKVMWTTNAGLTDRHAFDSRPDAWPRLRRGINFWVKDHRQIYLIGNPFVWYSATMAVVAYALVRGILILRAQRGYRDFDSTKIVKYDSLCGFLFIGWSLHYFPFFIMGRQLFLHHYFPALYFGILLACAVFDLLTSTLRPRVRLQIAAVLMIIAVWNFSYFSPLAYGSPWTKTKCNNAKWLKTWDFSCTDFLDDYSQYTGVGVATPQKSTAPVSTIGGEPGGRAAIVVSDVDEPGQADDKHTSMVEGKPEPGFNAFEGELAQGAKSILSHPNPPAVEDKEFSTVLTTDSLTESTTSSSEEKKETTSDTSSTTSESSVSDQSTSSTSTSSSGSSESESKTSDTTTSEGSQSQKEGVYTTPAGPLEQAEVEADNVADELYPDFEK